MPLTLPPTAELEQSLRDSVDALTDTDQPPPIVSISDIHGYLAEAQLGRVRITLGNHEALMLSPDQFGFSAWYSGQVDGICRLMHRHRSSAIHATPPHKPRGVSTASTCFEALSTARSAKRCSSKHPRNCRRSSASLLMV